MLAEVTQDAIAREIMLRADRLKEAVKAGGGGAPVAKRIGMPIPTLNNYLAGRDMKASALVALAKGCGVSIAWLADGQGEMDGSPSPQKSDFMPGFEALLHEPINFRAAFVLLRSCQEYHGHIGLKPTIAETLEWMGPPYLKARQLPDLKIEFQAPSQE
jgi:transcriptional regulator with XRE-family HTH domain